MKVIGFGLGRAGLSNQKLALLGLFARALEDSCAIALPRLCDFSTSKGATTDIELRDIFDLESLLRFAKDVGIDIGDADAPDAELLPFRDIFLLGSRTSDAGLRDADSLSAQFWRAVIPNEGVERRIKGLADQVFHEHGIQAVVQLRIEPDWQRYVASTLHSRNADDVPTTYQEILERVARTLGPSAQRLLLTCDETQVPVAEITRYAEDSLGISVAFKGQFLSDVAADQFTLRTALDFGLGLVSDLFVGTVRSTFANTVYATKLAMNPRGQWKHYIYTSTDERLVLRALRYRGIPNTSAIFLDALQNRGVFVEEPFLPVDHDWSDSPIVLLAHLAHQGDRISTAGWVRPVEDKHSVQGFSIDMTEGANGDVRYRARLADGTWSDWVGKRQFVGTRGKGEALTGFAVRLEGVARDTLRVEAIGRFTGSLDVVVAQDGEDCVPASGDGVLSGMQVVLRAASAARSLDAAGPPVAKSTDERRVPRARHALGIPNNSAIFVHASKNNGLFVDEPYISVNQHSSYLPIVLLAHLAHQGDRISTSGFLRPVEEKHSVQGFSIDMTEGANCDIRYRARLADGTWSDWVGTGQFVGTRGRSEALTGFAVRLEGLARETFQLETIGRFTGSLDFVAVQDGEDCVPVSGDGILSGMQVLLRAALATQSLDAAVPSFLDADPQLAHPGDGPR